MIGFGFAIAKSHEYIETIYMGKTGKMLDAHYTPIIFGTGFMILGILARLARIIQYGQIQQRIESKQFICIEPHPLPKILAF